MDSTVIIVILSIFLGISVVINISYRFQYKRLRFICLSGKFEYTEYTIGDSKPLHVQIPQYSNSFVRLSQAHKFLTSPYGVKKELASLGNKNKKEEEIPEDYKPGAWKLKGGE